jgi:hypothetical protein
MKSTLILTLLCFATALSAQNNSPKNNSSTPQSETSISIRGIVMDSLARSSVQGATVSLYLKGNSRPYQGVFSGKDGRFSLTAKSREVSYLKVSFVGYKDKTVLISQKQLQTRNVYLGSIYLASTGIQLQTVNVTTNVPEVVVKEDTIEYNAAAFKVPQNAVVEDLLKRLPGVEVDKDGKITTTSGKEVKRVYVDGKRFFGDDPKMATKNLTAEIVDKVQVVDKKSDLAILTGVDDDDSETVINITIKKGMKQGWMGNLTGGAGKFLDNKQENDPRYNTSIMLNRFRDNNQFSLIGNANNVNNRASTDRGNNVRTGRGTAGSNGITTSNNFGVNWASELNTKLKIESSASYNYSDDYSNSKSFVQNIFSQNDSVSYKNSTSEGRSYSNNYAWEGRLEYTPDKNTTIRLGTNFSYNSSLSNSTSEQSTRAGDEDSTLVNSSDAENRLSSSGTELKLQLDGSRKLSDKGRRLSLSGTYSTNHSDGKGNTNSITNYYQATSLNEKLDQRSNSKSNRDSYNFRTDYVEPVSKNTFLNFSYTAQFNNTFNQRLTYDRDTTDTTSLTGKYDILNSKYSRNSETNTVNQSIRAAFRGQYTRYTYSFGIDVAPVHTKSKTYIKDWLGEGNDSILNVYKGRTTVNYAPQLEFVYRFDDKSKTDSTSVQGGSGTGERGGDLSSRRGYRGGSRNSLRFRYNGRTDQPSVTQLDPTPNNTNPLKISSGNPELLPSFTQRIAFEYSKFNIKNQSSINATLNLSFVSNDIVNYTTYIDSTGGQSTKPVNVNGSWNTSSSLMWAKPFGDSNRFRFSTQTNATYRNQVGFTRVDTTSVKNITRNLIINQGFNLSYTNDWFYGQIRAQVNYTNISYNLGSTNGLESYVYSLAYNTQITMPYSWTLSSDISYSANRGLSTGYNQDQIVWNAELGRTVLSKGYLSLKVTDIFRQSLNLSRSVTDNSITDTQYTALTSYAMLSFTYRFANIGGKGRNRRMNFQGGGGMEMGRPDGPPSMGGM